MFWLLNKLIILGPKETKWQKILRHSETFFIFQLFLSENNQFLLHLDLYLEIYEQNKISTKNIRQTPIYKNNEQLFLDNFFDLTLFFFSR